MWHRSAYRSFIDKGTETTKGQSLGGVVEVGEGGGRRSKWVSFSLKNNCRKARESC